MSFRLAAPGRLPILSKIKRQFQGADRPHPDFPARRGAQGLRQRRSQPRNNQGAMLDLIGSGALGATRQSL